MRILAFVLALSFAAPAFAAGSNTTSDNFFNMVGSLPYSVNRWLYNDSPQKLKQFLWDYLFDEMWGVDENSDEGMRRMAVLYLNLLYYSDCLLGECTYPSEAEFFVPGWSFPAAESLIGITCESIQTLWTQAFTKDHVTPYGKESKLSEFVSPTSFTRIVDPNKYDGVHYYGQPYDLPRRNFYQTNVEDPDPAYSWKGDTRLKAETTYHCYDSSGSEVYFHGLSGAEQLSYLKGLWEARYEAEFERFEAWADDIPMDYCPSTGDACITPNDPCPPSGYSCMTENTRQWPRQ